MGTNVDKTVSKLQNELALWGAKLNELLPKAEAAGQDAKMDARKHLEDATAKLSAARSRLDEAKTTSEDKWDKFKAGLESSWKELESAFHKLTR